MPYSSTRSSENSKSPARSHLDTHGLRTLLFAQNIVSNIQSNLSSSITNLHTLVGLGEQLEKESIKSVYMGGKFAGNSA